MSKKKDKNKPPLRKPLRRWQLILIITMIFALTGLVVWSMSMKPPAPTAKPAFVPDPGPTAEQELFFRQRFLADWERIRTGYPIMDLRTRFDRLAHRVGTKDIRLHVTAIYANKTDKSVTAMADNEGQLKLIQFFAPAVIDMYSDIPDQELRDDLIIGILLHEEYHLDHHVFVRPKETLTQGILTLEENETWWWCVETIYLPMKAQGRLRSLPRTSSVDAALRAYADARGDRLSRAWMTFSRNASSER